jgi:hypothetical protein
MRAGEKWLFEQFRKALEDPGMGWNQAGSPLADAQCFAECNQESGFGD